MKKLKLHGFNNLTKSLSFCIYDICYAKTAEERDGYIAYIDELYNANRLTEILSETGSDSNLLIVFYVQIMPDDLVMQLHRF